ncbi:MAG TPA: enoyl-CoA hydratase/isomerase family protein [Bacteroidales bacterium]|nr:enoyl-CoA hydratase/isomerase family protein [Bacteroidales bacterium]
MEKTGTVQWEVRDSVGILSLAHPPENFLTEPEFVPLEKLQEWVEAGEVRALVITGTGRHFSAGADREEVFRIAEKGEELFKKLMRGKALLDYIENLPIPCFAMIRGVCFGGGLEIALACHIRYCSENALFAFPETNHGLMPGLGGTIRLPGKINFLESLDMILGGDMISADLAREIGLVDEIFPESDLNENTFHLIRKMIENRSAEVIRSVMQALHNARKLPVAEAMKEESRMFCDLARKEAERRKKNEE